MGAIYTFFIRVYFAIIFVAQYFKPKAKLWILGRKNQVFPKIEAHQKVIWFHCASLGEFDQGLPLMNLLKENNPNLFLLVTFFSPSGFENYNKRKHKVDFATYLPIDTPSNSKMFLTHFKPSEAYFVKYEFWNNFIFEAKKRQIKVFSVCAIFRKEHRFFKWYGGFFRKTLKQIDYFFVQNKTSQELLSSIGILNSFVVGDLRFDRVIEHKNNLQNDLILEQFTAHSKVWVIGSSWSVDEEFLAIAIKNFDGKIILAPHEISEKHLLEIEIRFQNLCVRYSQFSNFKNQKIIILDSIGKLANAYSYGDFAYVGGGFSGSLHNILEPAVFGLPIIIGPKHHRFPEAQMFIEKGLVFSVSEKEQLSETIQNIANKQDILKTKLIELVTENQGASEKIVRVLNSL